MVNASCDLTKAAFTKYVDNLIAELKVISLYDVVIASFVVKSEVQWLRSSSVSRDLPRIGAAQEVEGWMLGELADFIVVESWRLSDLAACEAILWSCAFEKAIEFSCIRLKFFPLGRESSHLLISDHDLLFRRPICLLLLLRGTQAPGRSRPVRSDQVGRLCSLRRYRIASTASLTSLGSTCCLSRNISIVVGLRLYIALVRCNG